MAPRPADSHDPEIDRRDRRLVVGLLAGDQACLGKLLEHYDRLVRYAIYRNVKAECSRDPTLIDSLASEVWTGFLDAVRRLGAAPDGPVSAYLGTIARNKCIDHARRLTRPAASANNLEDFQDEREDAPAQLVRLEEMQALRDCVAKLSEPDRNLLKEMELLMLGRWSEAAGKLELPESTVRFRWKKIRDTLKRCVEQNLAERPN